MRVTSHLSELLAGLGAAISLAAIATACGVPTALVGGFGYHVRGDEVFYTTGGGSFGPVSTEKVPGADGATFQALKGKFGKDKSSVYIGVYRIPGADAATFGALSDRYARDKSRAYFLGFPIAGADAASFHVLPDGHGRDRNRCYWNDKATKCPGTDKP